MYEYMKLTIEAVVLLISVYAFFIYWKYKDFPPGPYGLPLLGYALFLGVKPHLTLRNLSKKYGSVFSINIFGEQTVVVNDLTSIREVLVKQGDTFSSRPFNYAIEIIVGRNQNDIVTMNGPMHKELKRITIQILKNFGVGRSSMESVVVKEVDKLVTHLKTLDGQVVDISSMIFIPILNIVWGITAGTTVDFNDPETKSFADAICSIPGMKNIGILSIFPFLRYVAPELTSYRKLVEASNNYSDYIQRVVDQHYEDNNDAQPTDMMYAFIEESKKYRKDNKDQPPYCKRNLVGIATDMCVAGVEATVSTLQWALLLMAYFPDVQKKVQRELDERIAPDSFLTYSEKSTVPYTEATLCEIQRFGSVLPLAAPHCAARDTTLFGYKIPKGTTVLPLLFALYRDEEYWGDPHEFRPERFLDEEGRLKKHDPYIIFSAGPRGCPGEPLAKLELTLFFSSLMRQFSFEMEPNRASATPESALEGNLGITFRPYCTSFLIKCR